MIKIMTNYRLNNELEIDKLIELAEQDPRRMRVTISLPLNLKDTVNHQFTNFVLNRPHIFKPEELKYDDQGLIDMSYWMGGYPHLGVMDVRHPLVLFTSGRAIPQEEARLKIGNGKFAENQTMLEGQEGFAKTYLNPEALWLQVYTTGLSSHTTRLFTPINPDNIEALSHIPYHPDFATPPNWPGGKGKFNTPKSETGPAKFKTGPYIKAS